MVDHSWWIIDLRTQYGIIPLARRRPIVFCTHAHVLVLIIILIAVNSVVQIVAHSLG